MVSINVKVAPPAIRSEYSFNSSFLNPVTLPSSATSNVLTVRFVPVVFSCNKNPPLSAKIPSSSNSLAPPAAGSPPTVKLP